MEFPTKIGLNSKQLGISLQPKRASFFWFRFFSRDNARIFLEHRIPLSCSQNLKQTAKVAKTAKNIWRVFCRITNVLSEKSLNVIFDQLLFVLRYLRELRGFFIELIEGVYFVLAGISHPSYHVAQHFCKIRANSWSSAHTSQVKRNVKPNTAFANVCKLVTVAKFWQHAAKSAAENSL